ncbi:right-handed parallel beta-helix repeat-containing protein [uncultured Draconibacterium sp.]|uniref:right-handed parallel beta-helix repeat-containing protein n=1 Tax=uncultured Draconibacterium sp. TaxID=1573823 RepID=UPI0025CCFCCC|nr:right-handed parallel beta-helix repeat-containing protein [uncultured Draconibacterium sp.]
MKNIFKLILMFLVSFLVTSAKAQTTPFLNIMDFGAKGDGFTDDTPALLKAMEAATKSEGTVYFPHGNYCIHPVEVPSHITLLGYSAWSYANKDKKDDDFIGKTILTALSGDARALLDLGSNRGTRIFGLTLDGKNIGEGMHGIYCRHLGCEQNNCIEDCRIQNFSGSGIRLERSWVFSVRRNLLMFNGEHGIDLTGGYDGWVIDNQLTANKGYGLFARGKAKEGMSEEQINDLKFFGTASVMVTANRIEWNKKGGIYLNGSNSMQITGCAIDHNFGPGLKISNGTAHTVSGNLFRSSGVDAKGDECSQIWLENVKGASVTGNSIWGWYNRKEYKFSYPYPFYGIIAKNLKGCVITQNAMYHSSSKEGVSDRGGNESSIIKDNAYVKPEIEETEGGFRVIK